MKKHWKYLNYIIRHKWYVMIECFKIGLIWRGLVHDLSKFLPDEWFPYANYFYGPKGTKTSRRDKTGYYKPYETGDAKFDMAWLKHQKRNKHHWQWWVLPKDDGGTVLMPMPVTYVLEMICDWQGAGRARGYGNDILSWYQTNRDNMCLAGVTRFLVDSLVHGKGGKEKSYDPI